MVVGGDIERNDEPAAVEGRVVQIAFQGIPTATVDFRRIMPQCPTPPARPCAHGGERHIGKVVRTVAVD
jgi:hypothetical protein